MRVPAAGLSIRRIGPEDGASLNALAETDNLFDEDPAVAPSVALTPDGARDFLADPTVLFWLAQVEDLTVGFLHCCVQRRRTHGPWAELLLMEMGTRAGYRRQGIGRALIAAMEEWMRANGVRDVWVPADTSAVGFYRKCGFATDEGEILVKELH